MKKALIFILTVILVSTICIYVKIKSIQTEKKQILNYNNEYEFYLDKEILGTDITTLINKAMNENSKNEIKQDEKGLYIADDEKSILIYVKMKESDKVFPMESFYKVGITEFTTYFGTTAFKATNVEYHKNGKISLINFEEQ